MPNMTNSENKDRTYLSCGSSEGVEYSLYDNVKVYDAEYSEPHIGKIAKLWQEKASGTRKVLIRWFLRHKEVKPHVDDNPKELFLAYGEGEGVANENDLDVIVGKCEVVCTSKDPRNKQPSANDIENSDYFFTHVYDVDLEHTCPVETVIDKLGFNDIFNKQEWATALMKIDKKAAELHTNQESKNDVDLKELQLTGRSLSDTNARPRDAAVSNLQKKEKGKLLDLKEGHLSFSEGSKKKKIKVSDGKALVSMENVEKANSVSNTKEVVQSDKCRKSETESKLLTTMEGLNSGTGVEIQKGDTVLFSKKAEMEKKASSEFPKPFAASESTDTENASMLETISSEWPAVTESVKDKSILRQVGDKANLDEKAQSKANTVLKENMMLEIMDTVKPAEKDVDFLGENSDSGQFNTTKEVVRPDNLFKVETEKGQQAEREAGKSGRGKTDSRKLNFKRVAELEISPNSDSINEGRSNITKKMKIAKGVGIEKRPMSTVEMVKTIEKRKIFKELPWEENLQQGISYGKVLLLQNFDPLVTSADVRDMLKSTFQGLSDARVLPQETTCRSGQVLAIFETRLLADCALEAMELKCLVMTDNKRPVIASRVKESSSQFRFPGHLALEKLKLGRSLLSEDYTKAVSTSHCSQPNTIEFEMAMEWRQLQEISQNCWLELFKKQKTELSDLRSVATVKRSKQEGV